MESAKTVCSWNGRKSNRNDTEVDVRTEFVWRCSEKSREDKKCRISSRKNEVQWISSPISNRYEYRQKIYEWQLVDPLSRLQKEAREGQLEMSAVFIIATSQCLQMAMRGMPLLDPSRMRQTKDEQISGWRVFYMPGLSIWSKLVVSLPARFFLSIFYQFYFKMLANDT